MGQLTKKYGWGDLTEMQATFVKHMLVEGGRYGGIARSAEAAGYKDGGACAMKSPAVLAVLRQETEAGFTNATLMAMNTLVELADGTSNGTAVPPAVRRNAANDILDRAGMLVKRVTRQETVIEDKREAKEVLSAVLDKLSKLPPDLMMELVERAKSADEPDYEEAEYGVVDSDEDITHEAIEIEDYTDE